MLTISPTTLTPLSVSTHVLDLRFDASPLPLQIVARKFSAPTAAEQAPANEAVTLLLGNGVGCTSETWIPTMKRLYALHDGSRSRLRIRSVWSIECPNTGDATELNEDVIRENHSEVFRQKYYHDAVRRVIDTVLTAPERGSLIGVGHSAGCGAISGPILFNPEDPSYRSPILGFVFVEAPWMHRRVTPIIQEMSRVVREHRDMKRALVWPSPAEAMAELRARLPYKHWHPEVLQIMEETAFRPAPSGGVMPKTTAANEAATFADFEGALHATERLAKMMQVIPTHLIIGSRVDFWPPPLAKSNAAYIESVKKFAESITVIQDVGHYVPQERPEELAEALSRAITSLTERHAKVAAKL